MRSYDLSLLAENDLKGIWRYTYDKWGIEQAERYFNQIEACCEAVGGGHARSSKLFSELPDGVRIHRCEHHYIVLLEGEPPIIIAILHGRMDFMQRLKQRF